MLKWFGFMRSKSFGEENNVLVVEMRKCENDLPAAALLKYCSNQNRGFVSKMKRICRQLEKKNVQAIVRESINV